MTLHDAEVNPRQREFLEEFDLVCLAEIHARRKAYIVRQSRGHLLRCIAIAGHKHVVTLSVLDGVQHVFKPR